MKRLLCIAHQLQFALILTIFFCLTDATTSFSVVVVPPVKSITKVDATPESGNSLATLTLRHPFFPRTGSPMTRISIRTLEKKDCIVGEWSRWIRSGYFQVRQRSRLQNPQNGGLKCPPLVTARRIKKKYRDNKLTFDESSRRFLGSLIRGGYLQGDDPWSKKKSRFEKRKLSNSYLTKHYVWPKRLLLTVLDDSLCVRKTSLGLKTKFMVLSLMESLCGTTYDKNAPTVGLQTYSINSKLVMPLQRPVTKRELRHSVLAYTTEPVRHLQLDRALERTVNILNETINKKTFWKKAVLLVLSSWNYCDENTLGEAVLIKEQADVYLLLIGPEPDATQIQCFSSLASQPVEDYYIRLPDTDSINEFIAKILVAYYRNTFC